MKDMYSWPGADPEIGQQLGTAWTLDGEHPIGLVQVLDADAFRGSVGEPAYDLVGVGRIGHQEHVVAAAQIRDQVVDYSAGGIVATQGVIARPGQDAVQVVAERFLDECCSAVAANRSLA